MKRSIIIWLIGLVLVGCANRGVGPQGGPKDSIPPVPVKAEPEIGALNFQGDRIEVTFDEYIQLDNVAKHLIISPPQQNQPEVKARGKKLIVQFKDTLRDNTTYTLDFGSAVCDYREKVPLKGYSFYFSTGDEIDTLETFGRVYDAATLNPMEDVMVGIYSNTADSAFVSEPFLRIAKTDAEGRFRIGNIHPGTYRLYAVDDLSRDYRLTIGEALAYMDTTIRVQPQVVHEEDSTENHQHAESYDLFLFKEEQQKLYLQRSSRDEQHRITFLFSSSPDSLPQIQALQDSLHYFTHYSAKGDTMTVWLTDSMSIARDSLFFELKYRQTDSLYNLTWTTDTIRTIWRTPKLSQQAKEALDRKNRNRRLELRSNAKSGFDIFDTLRLVCTTPIASIAADSIHLYERADSVLIPVAFAILTEDSLPMRLTLSAELEAGKRYELQLDSAALHDIYGVTHVAANYSLQMKTVFEYSTLRVKLTPFEPKARIQVLNSKDAVLREQAASEEGAFFEYLKPDTYYLRLYIDENEDGKWTTGSWEAKRQPEKVYYFPEKIQTKSNWDFEEEWNYQAVEQTKSKPSELIKAAPKKK